jgi:hypothetical protein
LPDLVSMLLSANGAAALGVTGLVLLGIAEQLVTKRVPDLAAALD